MEDWARGRGDRILLHVHEDNPRAIAFYRRRGFVPTGRLVPYPPAAVRRGTGAAQGPTVNGPGRRTAASVGGCGAATPECPQDARPPGPPGGFPASGGFDGLAKGAPDEDHPLRQHRDPHERRRRRRRDRVRRGALRR
ncbi:GNAT family N-acetyltransferase [Curtobacterium sp. MCJR17_043]|nr:GNAT family N-acetyltransferase [Curtobacterium sp. MCJR17_043]WIB37098.1 GNAT family N-acetyltransferase [Curtobacterium sp. MCJR17_043]